MTTRLRRSRGAPATAVVSIDGSAYLAWQADLLTFSHARTAQRGEVVLIDHRAHVEGDDYPPYNRPYALGRWLEGNPRVDDVVVVLDPDMAFIRQVEWPRQRRPIAQDGRFPVSPGVAAALRRYGADPTRTTPPIPPLVLAPEDLARLAPVWFDYTRALRADPAARNAMQWLAESWACALAAREVGLRFQLRELAAVPPLAHARDVPLVHYAWKTACFDKRTYRPWADLPPCSHPTHASLAALIRDRRRTPWRAPGPAAGEVP